MKGLSPEEKTHLLGEMFREIRSIIIGRKELYIQMIIAAIFIFGAIKFSWLLNDVIFVYYVELLFVMIFFLIELSVILVKEESLKGFISKYLIFVLVFSVFMLLYFFAFNIGYLFNTNMSEPTIIYMIIFLAIMGLTSTIFRIKDNAIIREGGLSVFFKQLPLHIMIVPFLRINNIFGIIFFTLLRAASMTLFDAIIEYNKRHEGEED